MAAKNLLLRVLGSRPLPYLLWQPFISMMIICHLPIYFVKQVLGKFISAREEANDEFVGFGKGKGVGGAIYWLTWTRKMKRFGTLGFDNGTYMGMPISVHNWPLATTILGNLGIRYYIYLSATLLSIGLGWLSISAGHPWVLILVPLVLSSTYFIFNIYVSTWEILAWGFGFLAFAAFYGHFPAMAGIFLAAAILTHPGAGMLICVVPAAFAVVEHYPAFELVGTAVLVIVLTIWWIVPYMRSSHKLGRDFIINKLGKTPYTWDTETIYQFIIYAIFFSVTTFVVNPRWLLILVLPLFVLYYNVKIHWSFSKYTIYNYMLFVGAVFLALNPAPLSLLTYLLVIYTSGEVIWPKTGSLWGFDLTPVVLGETRGKIKEMFTNLKAGRIALEITKSRGHVGWTLIGPIGYILADEDIEILTRGLYRDRRLSDF